MTDIIDGRLSDELTDYSSYDAAAAIASAIVGAALAVGTADARDVYSIASDFGAAVTAGIRAASCGVRDKTATELARAIHAAIDTGNVRAGSQRRSLPKPTCADFACMDRSATEKKTPPSRRSAGFRNGTARAARSRAEEEVTPMTVPRSSLQ